MSCQLWWEWWHPRRSLFQSCKKNHLHDNWSTRKHIERHIRGDQSFAFVIVVHLVIWSSESSQMILDLKKHGSSCHWIPSLYLVDGVHAIWSLFEVELAILEVWWCWINICPLVVEDCETSLIVELLKAVDRESTRVLHVLELAGLQTFVVVRLSLASRASPVGNDLLWAM